MKYFVILALAALMSVSCEKTGNGTDNGTSQEAVQYETLQGKSLKR